MQFDFETENPSSDVHTRNLRPREGIEDPACGVEWCPHQLHHQSILRTTKTDFTLKFEQGTIVRMPSLIHTEAIRRNETIDVFVGGAGVVMLEGNFLV